jgi:Pyridoxamine 5'-phosphate oxidase
MSKLYDELEAPVREFILAQHIFFVGTAPSGSVGHVNVSPKGMDALRVLGPTRVAYLDYTGSGVETIAHVRDNGRIVLMFCAFEGPPKIVRLHGRGSVIEPLDAAFAELLPSFAAKAQARAIITVDLDRISDSCGFGVPSTNSAAIATSSWPGPTRKNRRESTSTSVRRT